MHWIVIHIFAPIMALLSLFSATTVTVTGTVSTPTSTPVIITSMKETPPQETPVVAPKEEVVVPEVKVEIAPEVVAPTVETPKPYLSPNQGDLPDGTSRDNYQSGAYGY